MLSLTSKQKEYWNNAKHRWNIKYGATRSGKTFLDYYLIPKRIRAVAGMDGLAVLLGNTKTTLQRNIIEPMQKIWGIELVSDIKSDNTAILFGEKVHCLGAEKANQVDKLRGSSIKYCYGDEVVTWHVDVFNMLKSRLDKPYSLFDGTCNPDGPNHWFKKFIDSNADIFSQKYTLYDNKFLDPLILHSLENEYAGTVFFDRYVLGQWKQAEGAIYKTFIDNTNEFVIDNVTEPLHLVTVGIDYGAGKSNTTFKATGFANGFYNIYSLAEKDITGIHEPEELYHAFEKFYNSIMTMFGRCDFVFADYGALGQIITAGLHSYCRINGIPVRIEDCKKGTILERIELTTQLMGLRRYKILKQCENLVKAFKESVWSEKKEDTRLDDGTSDIDSLDAFEYSVFPFYDKLIQRR